MGRLAQASKRMCQFDTARYRRQPHFMKGASRCGVGCLRAGPAKLFSRRDIAGPGHGEVEGKRGDLIPLHT
jgi:hypothetical protein